VLELRRVDAGEVDRSAAGPNGPEAGTSFFGGPEATGPFDGLQAEKARNPYAHVTCVKLPDEVDDDDALLLSDIFPTAWFGAKLAEIEAGDTVAVFGCGPVGLFSILSAQLQGAGRVLAVDQIASRLQQARRLGAEVIDSRARTLWKLEAADRRKRSRSRHRRRRHRHRVGR